MITVLHLEEGMEPAMKEEGVVLKIGGRRWSAISKAECEGD